MCIVLLKTCTEKAHRRITLDRILDKSKVTYRADTEQMKNFFFYYYSKEKESYVSDNGVHGRCETPCDVDHKYYWSNMPFNSHYNDRLHRNNADAVGCFGCSITFGTQLQESHTWPYLLAGQIKTECLNFGVPGAGIDSIFLNVKASQKDYKFKKAVILIPDFTRRIARIKHNGYWFQWPVLPGIPNLWNKMLPSPVHDNLAINEQKFIDQGNKVENKIINDKEEIYQKKVLAKLITHCEKAYDKFVISSWAKSVYEYLQSNYPKHTTDFYDRSGPTTQDKVHPTQAQNKNFADSVYRSFNS